MQLEAFITTLPSDAVVLTVNRRLATRLRYVWHRAHPHLDLKQGDVSILSFDDYIIERTQAYLRMHGRLSLCHEMQEQALWMEVAEQFPVQDMTFMSSYALAKQWMLTYQTQATLGIDYALEACYTQEQRLYAQARSLFQEKCQAHGWLPSCEALAFYIDHVYPKEPWTCPHIYVLRFDTVQGHVKRCLQRWSEDTEIITHDPEYASSDEMLAHAVCVYADADEEMHAAASWAYELWQKGETSVMVVVPDLMARRERIETIFAQTFFQASRYAPYPPSKTPYNISAGTPLSAHPLIHFALSWLHPPDDDLPRLWQERMHATYLGLDRMCLARVKRWLQDCDTQALQQAFWKRSDWPEEGMLCVGVLQAYETFSQACQGVQSMGAWLGHMMRFLESLGWPSARALNSTEYQAASSWMDVFERLFLAFEMRSCRYQEAFSWLYALTHHHLFQPETGQVPVNVLGILEASALESSHIWVAGVDERSWPMPVALNVWIPESLQIRFQWPHASATKEWRFAQQVLCRFLQSTHVVLSRPAMVDGLGVQKSALLDGPETYAPIPEERCISDMPLKQWQEIPQLTLPPSPTRPFSALTAYALCPLRAFVFFDLGLHETRKQEQGLPSWMRGQWVHRALEMIWQSLGSSAQLHALSSQAQARLVAKALQQARQSLEKTVSFQAFYWDIAQPIVLLRLGQVLDRERQRLPFTVAHTEKSVQLHLSQSTFHGRIDRVDKVGTVLWLLDYKTSERRVQDMLGAYPDYQLPLYALAYPDVQAVSYLQIAASKIRFVGISAYDDLHPDLVSLPHLSRWDPSCTTWAAVLERWRYDLTAQVVRWEQGHVPPYYQSPMCRLCTLKSICRWHQGTQRRHDDA